MPWLHRVSKQPPTLAVSVGPELTPDEPVVDEYDRETEPPWAEVLERLSAVEARCDQFHSRAAHREQVIDRLQGQAQEQTAALRREALAGVVADLIQLHDELSRQSARLAGKDGGEVMTSLASNVELVLEGCGLDTFSTEPGAVFATAEHTVVSVLETDDRSRHNTVAEVVGSGFRDRETDRVRRKVKAHFYRYPSP